MPVQVNLCKQAHASETRASLDSRRLVNPANSGTGSGSSTGCVCTLVCDPDFAECLYKCLLRCIDSFLNNICKVSPVFAFFSVGIEAVARIMEAWQKHEGVQCNGCLALMALVRGDGSVCQVSPLFPPPPSLPPPTAVQQPKGSLLLGTETPC